MAPLLGGIFTTVRTLTDVRQQILLKVLVVLPCKTGLKKDGLIQTGFN